MNKDVRSGRRAALCALAALLIAAALPSTAGAATGSVADGVLTFTGGSGVDDITISFSPGYYNIEDSSGIAPTAGTGCTTSAGKIRCDATGVSSIVVDLGDGDDKVTNLTLLQATVDGGIGVDQIATGIAADRITGGEGNDILDGGWGNDVFLADPGGDVVDGGLGTDTFDYSARTAPVTATLADGADDGATGEGDDLTGVETVLGGSGGDHLVGTSAADKLVGGPGSDSFDGGAGADRIEAADGGPDTGTCGSEADVLTFDAVDVFDASCEGWTAASSSDPDSPDTSDDASNTEPTPPAPPTTGSGTGTVFTTPIAVTFGATPAPFDVRRGTVALALSCADDALDGCTGKVTLSIVQGAKKGRVTAARRRSTRRPTRRQARRRKIVIGSKRFKVSAGKEAKVPVRLSRRGRRVLGKRRRSRVQAAITMNTPAGKKTETRTIVVERRVARKKAKKRKPSKPRRARGRRR